MKNVIGIIFIPQVSVGRCHHDVAPQCAIS